MSKYHNNLVHTAKALLDDKSIELKMGVMLPGAEAPDDSPRQTVKPDLIETDAEDNITTDISQKLYESRCYQGSLGLCV